MGWFLRVILWIFQNFHEFFHNFYWIFKFFKPKMAKKIFFFLGGGENWFPPSMSCLCLSSSAFSLSTLVVFLHFQQYAKKLHYSDAPKVIFYSLVIFSDLLIIIEIKLIKLCSVIWILISIMDYRQIRQILSSTCFSWPILADSY